MIKRKVRKLIRSPKIMTLGLTRVFYGWSGYARTIDYLEKHGHFRYTIIGRSGYRLSAESEVTHMSEFKKDGDLEQGYFPEGTVHQDVYYKWVTFILSGIRQRVTSV